jgi:putative transposase
MFTFTENRGNFHFHDTLTPFAQADELPFANVLTEADLAEAFANEQVGFGKLRHAFWTPPLTLWAFLWQVLSADKSCRQAVANVVLALALSRPLESLDTAAYCRARAKLPAPALQRLTLLLGQRLETACPDHWRWHGRHVKLVDGSTSQLPDTLENQKAFPQQSQQKKGLGFPIIRWVVLLSLMTAAVQGFAYGRYAGKQTGEPALFRELLGSLQAGDIVLADRFYCSYFMVALLVHQGVDVVARLHQKRKYDFRRGQRLGEGDHIVAWKKPERPQWMDEATYAAMPDELRMREVYRVVNQPGYRVKELVIATTLLDAEAYTVAAIGEIYSHRWHAELDIRNLKTTLGMDYLRCKTPRMVAKEIWAHLLAYNLVRKVMAQAAQLGEVHPRALSFKATKQALLAGWPEATKLEAAAYACVATRMLRAVGTQNVGNRPGRCEPRAVKRRPKAYDLLTKPRQEAQANLLAGKPWKG